MTCSKNFDRVLRATCLGLVAMLAVAGCGGSSNNPADAKPASGDGTVIGSDVPPANLAILSVSPASVDLGSVDVGATSGPATVTVTNSGKAASGALTVTVSGTGITATGCTGTLAVGAACTISITAHPAAAGAISGTIAVAEGASAPKTISVSGVATVPGQFSLTPPGPVDLGKVVIKGTATASIVVTNTATTGLTGIVVTVGGTGYALSPTTTTCTDSLAVGQTCTIVVGFTAATGGVATGSVIVSQGGVTKSVALSATVQAPAKLAMTPPTAALTATVGGSSTAVTFYVTNSGDVASGVPTVLLGGPNAADFSIATNSCVTSLAGGATSSCSASVVFSPKVLSTANETATLTVSDPGPGASSVVATLSGTAVGPSQLVLSGSPDLGIVVVGATGTPVSLTLKNGGDNNSGAIALSTNDPGEFAVVTATDTCTGVDLKKNATCTFSMTFTPSAGAAGVLTARLTASGASTANPAVLGLTATAVPPAKLVAAPVALDFGSIPTNQESAPLTLTISNSGGAPSGPLTVSNTGAQFKIKGDTCTGASLTAAGTTKSCTIIVTFTSVAVLVDATGSVTVTDGQTSATATLHGAGMAHPTIVMAPQQVCPQYPEDDLLCTPMTSDHAPTQSTIRFLDKVVGKTTPEMTFTVFNETDPTFAVDSGTLTFTITGPAAADFAIVKNNCTAPLVSTSSFATAPTTCVLTLTATPGAVGLRNALLVLTTSRGGVAQTTLEAKGLAPIEVQPIQVSKTHTGLDFGQVSLGHNDAANDSLAYRVWVRDTTSADRTTTVTVTLPTPTPADFVWPATSVTTFTISDPDHLLTPPVGIGSPRSFGGGGTNACSNKTLSLALGPTGDPTATSPQAGYTYDGASGYWYCDFPVEFFPQSGRGALSAALTATGTNAGTSAITLTGNATGPLKISPSPFLLADPVAVGLASTTNLTLTITNQGEITQTGLSFGLSGTGAGDFQIVGTTCWTKRAVAHALPAPTDYPTVIDQLAKNEDCLVWLGFQPTAQGPYSVTFTVTAANGSGTADDETATDTVQTTGSKTFGALTVTPNPGTGAVFADTPFGKTDAAPVAFVVKNNGTVDATNLVYGVAPSTDFEVLPSIGVAGACSTSASYVLAGGGTCTIQVRAKPGAATLPADVGKKLISGANLTVTATSGGETNTVSVPLSYYETSNIMVSLGTGQPVSSLAFAFPAAGYGPTVPVTQNFTVSNVGSSDVTLAFTAPAQFVVSTDPVTGLTVCTAGILHGGAQCTLVVRNLHTALGIVGPNTLIVADAAHPAENQATLLLSSTTLDRSKLVAIGITGNSAAATGWSVSGLNSTGRIDLGTAPLGQAGGDLTLTFQNQGGVATQPLHFRWDTGTTTGTADAFDAEFVLTGLYPENQAACLSANTAGTAGSSAGGQAIQPNGFCTVTLHFAPSSLSADFTQRLRNLWVIDQNMDTGTSPEVFLQATPLPTPALSVEEVTSGSDGFLQFATKAAVTPTTPESHTFKVTNNTAGTLTVSPTSSLSTWFAVSAGPATSVDCTTLASTQLGTGLSCQFVVKFTPPSQTTQVFPWTTVAVGSGTVLGLMGRTQQLASLQIMQSASAPSCPLLVGTDDGCVDFTSLAIGAPAKTQALTVVNMGDVVTSSGLVVTVPAGVAGATFGQDGACDGHNLNPYGTAGDRCVITVSATGTGSVAATSTAELHVAAGSGATTTTTTQYGVQAEVVKAAALKISGTNTFAETSVTGHTAQTFTIYNGVNDPNDVTFQRSGTVGVTITGAGASQFQLVGSDCAPNLGLASGDSCTVTVWFAPTALSPDGNQIVAALNVSATPGTAAPFTLQGMPKSALSITSPILDTTVTPPKYVMDALLTGKDVTFTVTNDSTQVTASTSPIKTSISNANFMLIDDQCYGLMLANQGTCTIRVKYIGASTTTAQTATLTINGGSPGQSTSVALTYTGVAATTH